MAGLFCMFIVLVAICEMLGCFLKAQDDTQKWMNTPPNVI